MKAKKQLVALLYACFLPLGAQNSLSLVPLPAEVVQGEGVFHFSKTLKTAADAYDGDSIRWVLDGFARRFSATTGIGTKEVRPQKATLYLKLNKQLGCEAYKLCVSSKKIIAEASRPAGFFYALQTLQQLLPTRAVLAGCTDGRVSDWTLPVVSISDRPRFGWRGFMLDEGRHFYGKDEVKKIIDLMAAYKMNRFHWHLTEDQGWRIEIKKYPKLTTVGAWRTSTGLGWQETQPDSIPYGGFYTQDDAREIVKYARDRFIEIVPEIDIPGHSQAAVAAYPEFLACDPEKKHEVWLWQGVSPDVINVSNPKAVQFAKDVIDELAGVFPFGCLHLGGDECPTEKWEGNADCQRELKELGSTNYRDLQLNFYRKLKEHIDAKPAAQRRKLIFWNEVLHGNTSALGNDFTVMAWVGADKAAKEAAGRGLTTILSPQPLYYINRKQSTLPTEPHSQGKGTETVEAVYNYVPQKDVPGALQQKYMGVQANFWTEWVKDASTLQYLMLPRLAAVAEAGWTPQQLRDYPDFLRRLQAEQSYYIYKGVNYGKHVFKTN